MQLRKIRTTLIADPLWQHLFRSTGIWKNRNSESPPAKAKLIEMEGRGGVDGDQKMLKIFKVGGANLRFSVLYRFTITKHLYKYCFNKIYAIPGLYFLYFCIFNTVFNTAGSK